MNTDKIDLETLGDSLRKFENRWVAISEKNMVVASGLTYSEALEKSRDIEVALFRVPPLDSTLAP